LSLEFVKIHFRSNVHLGSVLDLLHTGHSDDEVQWWV